MKNLSIELIRELFSYDPEAGTVTRRVSYGRALAGERIHLGSFETHDEAAEAYKQAAIQYHGEFTCLD